MDCHFTAVIDFDNRRIAAYPCQIISCKLIPEQLFDIKMHRYLLIASDFDIRIIKIQAHAAYWRTRKCDIYSVNTVTGFHGCYVSAAVTWIRHLSLFQIALSHAESVGFLCIHGKLFCMDIRLL